MSGLLLPQSGTVWWGDAHVASLDRSEVFDRVALLTQDFQRWPVTAALNIRIGRPAQEAGPEDLQPSVDYAGAGPVIAKLPEGLRTLLARMFRGASELSGGEWQKIGLVRTHWRSRGPLWAGGRRYREVTSTEATLLADHVGPGRGRPALDIGTGEGSLARHLHQLGCRTTGIDFAPSAITAARKTQQGEGPAWHLLNFTSDDLGALPDPAYAVVTCRLVYRWMDDKAAFLDRVRQVLAPGGTFWVVTEIASRREPDDPYRHLGISPA